MRDFAGHRGDVHHPSPGQEAADAFDRLEADGKPVRDVAPHIDMDDCIIRCSKENSASERDGSNAG